MNEDIMDISGNDESELLKIYDRSERSRSDDAAAMQACVCILLTAAIFAASFAFPELVSQLVCRIKELSASPDELFTNPIALIERLF